MLAKSTDYGLPIVDQSLFVANTSDSSDTHFLVQAELKAIKNGFKYIETEAIDGFKYKGYVKKNGLVDGVGISIHGSGHKQRGEWHALKLHGAVKVTNIDGNTYWGEYKNDKKEGFGTFEFDDGERYNGQFMQDNIHGYGIYRWLDGRVYKGQYTHHTREGYAYFRFPDGKEYYGQFKNDMPCGDGVIIESGKPYSVKFEKSKLIRKTKYEFVC
jgi:hypothetical protein